MAASGLAPGLSPGSAHTPEVPNGPLFLSPGFLRMLRPYPGLASFFKIQVQRHFLGKRLLSAAAESRWDRGEGDSVFEIRGEILQRPLEGVR